MKKISLIVILCTLSGCAYSIPPVLYSLNPAVHQAMLVRPIKPNSFHAHLSTWEKLNGQWYRVRLTWAVLGRAGLALPNTKKEGDDKTPAGTFTVDTAFGYTPSLSTGLNYRQVTTNDFWVDDINSAQYNQWVQGIPEGVSHEKMRREDNLYALGAVINYNTGPIIPGAGSAIFLHLWRNYHKPTSGCVALNQRELRKILRWLKTNSNPVIILE